MIARLPRIELAFYSTIWCLAVFYSFYNVYHYSKPLQRHLLNEEDNISRKEDILNNVFGRARDTFGGEWEHFLFYINHATVYLILNLILSEILRKCNLFQLIPIIQLTISFLFIYLTLGSVPFLLVIIQPLTFKLFTNFNSKTMLWVCAGLNYLAVMKFIDNLKSTESIIIPGIFWITLRCLSYFLDDKKSSFVSFLSYCFYLPLLTMGPFIFYEDYEQSIIPKKQEAQLNRLKDFTFNTLRFIFWAALLQISLYYFYTNFISYHPELVETMNNWVLYGFGYTMGQYFHVKYVVMYGLSTTLAKFDGIPVPNIPKCIGRIHLYSDMWKYFDIGFYRFIVKYLYIPVNGTKIKLSKILSTAICFVFVYIWHGLHLCIFIWSLLNFIGVIAEYIANDIYNKYLKNTFEEFLSPQWRRRAFCIFASPLLGLSAVSNFYYFSNIEVGYIFLQRYLFDSFLPNLVLLFILYCMCQVSAEIKMWDDKKKKALKLDNKSQ